MRLMRFKPALAPALAPALGIIAMGGLLAGCQVAEIGYGAKHLRPLSIETKGELAKKNMRPGSPILVRIFKQESVLEIWKQDNTGRFALLRSFPICKWSGKLGPKIKEGDRQAPEGFYEITPGLMNPRSSYYLAFNLGFPNNFDRSHGRTGKHLMVHGACSSAGCYAMSDAEIQEIYSLARESFRGGQRSFQVQAFPFRMTPENMAKYADHPQARFWRMLKEGSDHFEITRLPPKIDVCNKRYVFDADPVNPRASFVADRSCPKYTIPESLAIALAEKQTKDEAKMRVEIARLEDVRKEKEEREKAKLAAAEREKAFRRKSKALFSSILGGSGEPEETKAADGEDTAARTGTGAEGGVAKPRRSPRNAGRKVAAKKSSKSWFSSMFSSE